KSGDDGRADRTNVKMWILPAIKNAFSRKGSAMRIGSDLDLGIFVFPQTIGRSGSVVSVNLGVAHVLFLGQFVLNNFDRRAEWQLIIKREDVRRFHSDAAETGRLADKLFFVCSIILNSLFVCGVVT